MRLQLALLAVLAFLVGASADSQTKPPSGADDLIEALSSFTSIGPLRLHSIPSEAIRVRAKHNVDGDILFVVAIHYKRDTGGANTKAALGPLAGTIRQLDFEGYITINSLSPGNQKLMVAEANQLRLEVQAVNSSLPTGFGEPVDVNGYYVQIVNTTQLVLSRSQEGVVPSGVLEVRASDLRGSRISMALQDQENLLKAQAKFRMPGQSAWSYDLSTQRSAWEEGTLVAEDIAFTIDPPRAVTLGGVEVTASGFGLGRVKVVKKRGDNLAAIELLKLQLDASGFAMRRPEIKGRLDAPLVLARASGLCQSRETHFDIFDLTVENDHPLVLRDASYRDEGGVEFTAQLASLDLKSYRGKDSRDPERESIDGSIELRGGELRVQSGVTVTASLTRLKLSLTGRPDRPSGLGEAEIALATFSGEVPIDPREVISKNPNALIHEFRCSHPLMVRVDQASAFAVNVSVALVEGKVTGTADLGLLVATLTPSYYRCEWDQPAFRQQMFNICIDGWSIRRCDYTLEVNVHWIAELHPSGSKTGALVGGRFVLGDGQPKLCGGRIGMVPGLWALAIGPNFNGCGEWYCNSVRDAIRGAYVVFETPFTTFLGSLGGVALPFFEQKC